MTKTNQRITLTNNQYWMYFLYPLILSVPLIIILIQMAIHQLAGLPDFDMNNAIWVSNVWVILVAITFYRRWDRLYFYEIPIKLTDKDFRTIMNTISIENRWKQEIFTNNHAEYYRLIEKGSMKKEWIVIKRFSDKILAVSISNPNILDFNRLFNNHRNLSLFEKTIKGEKSYFLKLELEEEAAADFWVSYLIYFTMPLLMIIGSLGFFVDIFYIKNGLIGFFFILIIYAFQIYRFTDGAINPNKYK